MRHPVSTSCLLKVVGSPEGRGFVQISQLLLCLLPELVLFAFGLAIALPDLVGVVLDFFFCGLSIASLPSFAQRQSLGVFTWRRRMGLLRYGDKDDSPARFQN